MTTTAKPSLEFEQKIEHEALTHISTLIEEYGYGWELYIKCDNHGHVRFCPKGEVVLRND